MARRAPLIHYLVNVERWIWLLIGGGGALFIGLVIALAASHPTTAANALVTWENGWIFVIPAAMVGYGVWISLRWWRCPGCGLSLPTKQPVPDNCPRCKRALREA